MRKLIFHNIWPLDLNHESYWKGKLGVYFSLSETIIRYKNKFNDAFHIFEKKKRLFWNSKTSYKNDNWRFYEEYCPNQKILLGENSFVNFPCKTVVFRASTRIFQQVIIVLRQSPSNWHESSWGGGKNGRFPPPPLEVCSAHLMRILINETHHIFGVAELFHSSDSGFDHFL